MRKLISQLLLLVGLTLLFNACGSEEATSPIINSGGGIIDTGTNTEESEKNVSDDIEDEPSDIVDRETQSGIEVIFIDTFCSGLSYTAISVDNQVIGSGTTGADGSANIPEGTTYIQFQLGDLVLGKVSVSQVVTISELFKNSNIEDNRVIFASRLLLTIDEDSNPDNGIQVSETVSNSIGTFVSSTGYTFTSFDLDGDEVTTVLTELMAYLGLSNRVYSEDEAKSHLSASMENLESDITLQILNAYSEECIEGGIKKSFSVDFNKADNNTTPSNYLKYYCNDTTSLDHVNYFKLEKNHERCGNGGIRANYKSYSENEELLSTYDKYICNGEEAYQNNSFIKYSIGTNSEDCSNVVTKNVQVTDEDNVSILRSTNETICADNAVLFPSVYQIVSNEICKIGGVKVDYFATEDKSVFISSTYYCNQATEKGYFSGEHTIVEAEANRTVCPDGGKEYKHSVDSDNNGDLETFYSEVKCDGTSSTEDALKTTIDVTKVLLTSEMSDFEKCPYGGYRIEKVMKRGSLIIAQFNDYDCNSESNQLFRDEITPVVLKASDYSKTSSINKWCPNGGFKYIHKIYYNEELDHQYFDINCSPVSTLETNSSTILNIGSSICPYGGEIVTHSVIFNGDNGHSSNYEYNSTHCKGFDWNQTVENVTIVSTYSDAGVDCTIELHQRFLDGKHLITLDYNTTTCTGLEWNNSIVNEIREDLAVGNEKCPDGGQEITYERSKPDGTVISDWTYTIVICDGLDYNETYEVNNTIKSLAFGDKICPYGGKIVSHERYRSDTGEHVSRWDYNATVCNRVEYNETSEEIEIVATYVIGDGNKICPDGGKKVLHKRFVDGNHVPYWDYNTTTCEGLDYNQTYSVPVTIDDNPTVCPYGGKVITYKRYTINGDQHVAKWDYNSTICNSLEYNQTREESIEIILPYGNKICPDGGKIVNHKRFADFDGDGILSDHVSDWDYSETICQGLDYNQTLEINQTTILEFGNEICPDGGKIVLHQFFADLDGDGSYSDHISKWDFSSTHCEGLEWNSTKEVKNEITLPYGNRICPDGGKIISYKRFADFDGDGTFETHVAKWDFNSTQCNGLDYDMTEDCGTSTVWSYGESSICPDGGIFAQHQRWTTVDGTCSTKVTHVAKWDYNTTTCKGLEYNQTLAHSIEKILSFGDKICPDGGKKTTHLRYIDKNGNKTYDDGIDTHVEKWDYNTTTCLGLDYNQTLSYTLAFDAPERICPDGGSIITNMRYIDTNNNGRYDNSIDIHVAKWDFNSTHCIGLEYSQTLEHNITTEAPLNVCPDGGSVIKHIRYIDVNGNRAYDVVADNGFVTVDGQFSAGNSDEVRQSGVIEILNSDATPANISLLTYDENIVKNLGVTVQKNANNGQIIFSGNLTVSQWNTIFRTVKLIVNEGDTPKTYAISFSVKNNDSSINEGFQLGNIKANPETSESLTASLSQWIANGISVKGYTKGIEKSLTVVTTQNVLHDYTSSTGLPYHVSTGLGVTDGQIEWHKDSSLPAGGYADKIIVKFDTPVTNVEVGFTGLGGRFIDSAKAVYEFYYQGQLVRTKGRLDRSADFDGDGYLATNVTSSDLLIDEMVFTIEIDGSDKSTANYSVRYIKGNQYTDRTVFTKVYQVENKLASDRAIPKWTYSSTYCVGLDYNQTLKHETNTTLLIGDESCPDGGTLVQTIRYIDKNSNGTYEEDIDTHIVKWDFSSTYCTGLDYNQTLEHNITVEAPLSECPYGGSVITHIRYIDKNNNSILDDGEETISKWQTTTTHCSADLDIIDLKKEIILPIGDENCPTGGKIVEHNVSKNGIVDQPIFETIHCGREGYSVDAELNTSITIAGYITDMNGSRLEGVEVYVSINGEIYKVTTGINGVYQIYNAQYGSEITALKDGYKLEKSIANGSILDFVLVPDNLSYVDELDLKFFNFDRAITGDKAIELANINGWRLLTFDEISALYYSKKREFFQKAEYLSGTKEFDANGNPVVNEWGYNLLTLDFSKELNLTNNAIEDFPKGYSWVHKNGENSWEKHAVFVENNLSSPISAKSFVEFDAWTDWYNANMLCSMDDKRLPTADEMKKIYFNSGHPFGTADQDIKGGDYWLVDIPEDRVNPETGDEYKDSYIFRVLGPTTDYWIFPYTNPNTSKKVLCVELDSNENISLSGFIHNWDQVAMNGVKITFKLISDEKEQEDIVETTNSDGSYSLSIPSGRYFIEFDPTDYAKNIGSEEYKKESITIDLRFNTTLNKVFTQSEASENSDEDSVCNNSGGTETADCEIVAFNVDSRFDAETNLWTYSVTKGANANVDMKYFTLKLSSLCMEQITKLNGGTAVSSNTIGVIDSIQSETGTISFIVNSTSEYNNEVNTPLTITTSKDEVLSANIATPVCFPLAETKSVEGKIIDNNGNPIAGANIEILVTDGGENYSLDFVSDTNGKFSSSVEIVVSNSGAEAMIFNVEKEGYTYEVNGDKKVNLAGSEVKDFGDIILEAELIDVTGNVTDKDGNPIKDALIKVFDEDEELFQNLTTDSQGLYSFETKVGNKLSIQVEKENFNSKSTSLFTVTSSVNNFNFELEVTDINVKIVVKVTDELNNKIENSIVSIVNSDDEVISSGRTDENGECELNISKKFGTPVSGTINISEDSFEKMVENITISDTSLDKNYTLIGLPASLRILAFDKSTPLQNVAVNLYKIEENAPYKSAITLFDGVTLKDIPAGTYRVILSMAGYTKYSKDITLLQGEVFELSAYMSKVEEEVTFKSESVLGTVYKYFRTIVKGSSTFKAEVSYNTESKIWTYKISRESFVGSGAELSHWYLDLDDTCLANLENVSARATIGIDSSTSDYVKNASSVLKWDTTGGEFSFKIKNDIDFEYGQDIKVPILFKAGTVGDKIDEGFVIVNIPAPICSGQ
jgi:protocatechuate 3,4-dioxygenase beta subunit